MSNNRSGLVAQIALCAVLALSWISPCAAATLYPTRPIKLVVSFGPGSTADLVARIMSESLPRVLGVPVIVDNHPGAGGTIGNRLAAQATPDGYTLLLGEAGVTMAPNFFKSLPYNVLTDLTPITEIAGTPMLLVVGNASKAKTLKELVALARAEPGKLNYASAGVGSPVHMATELFKSVAKINVRHIPYKGGAEMVSAAISGQVDMLLTTLPTVLGQVKGGKLRPLAITTGGQRSPALPDVPTMTQAGLDGATIYTWTGLFGPAGLPPHLVARLHEAALQALATSTVKASLAAQGAEIVGDSPRQFAAYVRSETERWAAVAKVAGIQKE